MRKQAGGGCWEARYQVLLTELRSWAWSYVGREPRKLSQQGRHRSGGVPGSFPGMPIHSLSIPAPFSVGQGAQEPSIQHIFTTYPRCSRP